ncbi:hypothetical protein [Aneurinibacillus aneurinilyticus]|jgi:hypothetical protein|uniref:Uncharacterized protein n=2 Tax=Aneurinibacillus aneurinilyticus TaxID=1391 RepID=A0A848CHG8_ANEAE|nr:hypothetical protein [Aneurinibacillus aneurinilyticus]ERI09989.1 hypothetical protein HMPREF0083_01918 [Aneurinibacillus aneurinilyticus ATCC 12856]MCI1692578.1 hypothetical protein [Aneurinibacillus aneurinilyticus]MED0670226.1 hypothetical protein [Aneurinibacillus aneurinilyticus]MED0705162.1 hypothetical protein [Aneurinibacillus aneurinilyticus]MED0725658.1 hypothetical protein [Aneurinibacillus aneurinilyticus]
MEAIEKLDALHRRFERLRQVVDHKRLQVQWIEEEVRMCFQQNNVQGIAKLAREREHLLGWITAMESFIVKWEQYWREYDAVSGWFSAGLHVQE